MQLILVCADEPARAPGVTGLSGQGRRRAHLVATALAAESWDAIYHSADASSADSSTLLGTTIGLTSSAVPELNAEEPHDADASARVVHALQQVVARHPGQRVAVTTTRFVITSYVGSIWGLRRAIDHEPAHAGVTRTIASRRGVLSLESLNETGHLSDAEPAVQGNEHD